MLEALMPLLDVRKVIRIMLWPVLRSLSIVRALTFPWAVRSYMDRLS
jgi:glutaredoxin 2